MLELRWYTKDECERSVATGASDLNEVLANAVRSAPTATPADRVALIAFLDEKMVGRILFTYGGLADNDSYLRVAAAQDLFTDPQCRGKGVGSGLIAESLKLGIPCIYSGMSAQAQPIYEKMGFSFIDTSPIYRLPIGICGLLRHWRTLRDVQGEQGVVRPSAMSCCSEMLRSRWLVAHQASDKWLPVPADDARNTVRDLFKLRHRRFQVPWNLKAVDLALNGGHEKNDAIVIGKKGGSSNDVVFVSISKRKASVRIPYSKKFVQFIDGHVNEVYPPLRSVDDCIGVIGAIFKYGVSRHYSNLSIYAMTPDFVKACDKLGLRRLGAKSVAISPVGLNGETQSAILSPNQWWCRSLNENHFEEAGYPGVSLGRSGCVVDMT